MGRPGLRLHRRHLRRRRLHRRPVSGGTLTFIGSKFSGGNVDFTGTEFSGGTVDFSKAASVAIAKACGEYMCSDQFVESAVQLQGAKR